MKDLHLEQHRVAIAILKLSVSERNSTVLNTNSCGLQSHLRLIIQYKCLFGNDTNKEFKYRILFFFSKTYFANSYSALSCACRYSLHLHTAPNNLKWWFNPNVLPLSLPESE